MPSNTTTRAYRSGGDIQQPLVAHYAADTPKRGVAHALRATAATNILDHEADIAKVQEWLGHANIAATRIYDRRKMKRDSPTFKTTENGIFVSLGKRSGVDPEMAVRRGCNWATRIKPIRHATRLGG